jgi:amino acid adenylation domain-containing protein
MAKDAEALSLASFKKSLEWNGKLPQAVQTLVHSLIHDQAVKNGEAQAVCSWDGDLTYAELDALSSRLGTYLGTHGVGPEVIVPLCFEKSKWAIVAILGVLKAGGAFLLLDPSQPIARLESIVKQTGAKLALSSVECFDTCKILIKQVFVIDGTSISSLESSNTSAIQPGATPGNAAYYIFTSGSTGNPKGVAIENSSLSTTATNIAERLGYGSGSRVFQFASYAFDACITDIFGTLASGATLCIPSEWERNNGIVGALRRMNVDNAKFTPSLATNLAFEDVPTFKTLVLGFVDPFPALFSSYIIAYANGSLHCSGESCPPSLLEKWSRKIRMILVYGPTECCVICFTADASQQATVASEIGRTVGARAWIVKQDNYNELAQIGETGELLIEGPLVARGYLNDKAKTEQQFIQNPLWMIGHQKQSRMYRTGDLASYLDDGRVCYAGRIDNQVKIRGQRLELEEVESKMHDALAQIGKAGSKRVIVDAVIFSGLSSKQLVAFVCPDESESIGSLDWHLENGREINTTSAEQERFSSLVSALEESLRLLLPIYAVPTVWIPLKSLPLTISRKADRRRLRDIVSDFSVKQLGIFTQKPSDLTAQGHELNNHGQKLQALWANVFNVVSSTIEAGDNFFSLGGDSVMAIKLIAAARSKGLDLTLDIVFKHPVLYDMSVFTKDLVISKEDLAIIPPFGLLDQSLDANVVCREASKACSIPMECIDDIYPCSPMQEGLLALSMKDPGTYILQFVYQMPKSIDLDRLKSAWKAVAKHAQVLRTRFFDFDSGLYQVVVDQPMNWGVVDGDLDKFFSSEKERGLKFGEPMSRHTVLRQHHKGSTEYFLIWTIHHALIDGWSESDITTAVEAEYLGKASTISKAPRYNKFINYINKQDQESGRQFWLDQLEDAPVPVFPPLPSSSYVPKVERSNRIDHHLEEHAEAELKHNVPSFKKGSVTPATMIQAAWFILLGIYSDASDVVTGLTLNGRAAQLPGIDSIPGPTVTTIPFRTRLSPDMKLTELLQNTQDQYLSIIPFSQFGLHNIRRLSEGAIAACKFRTLLVVQSANNSKNSRQLLLGRSYFFPVMDFALVMECELQGDTIDFRATFDHQILREEEVRRIFQQMADILRRMSLSDSDTEVFELQKISDSDLSQIKKWNSSTDQVDSGQSDITWLVDPGHTNNLIPIGGVGEIVVQDPTAERVYLHGLFLDTSNLIDTPDWYKSDNLATEPKFAKTGVLAKYLWDGVLSPLGRKEDQVAIQGQRVDVTEVEDQLREAISRHSLSEPQGLAITTISGSEGKPLLAAFMAVDEDGVDGNVEPLVLPEDTKGLEKFHVLVEEVDTDLRSKIPDHKIPQVSISILK